MPTTQPSSGPRRPSPAGGTVAVDGSGMIPAGTRVQIRARVLEPGERAPGLPPDTAQLPYELRCRGVLLEPCRIAETATIATAARRTLVGQLELVEPADTHTFGRPHAALVEVAERIGEMREAPR